MGLFSEKKMNQKRYDFLEDIFVTISDKWYEKDRAMKLNDNVRCNINYLTYLLNVIDAHRETRNVELDFTPFVAAYHYVVANIHEFSTMVEIIVRSYGDRAFTETPEVETGLNPLEHMERDHLIKTCTVEYLREFLKEMCGADNADRMSLKQILGQSIFGVFRLVIMCMFYMEQSYVHHYFDDDDADDFLRNFDGKNDDDDWAEI